MPHAGLAERGDTELWECCCVGLLVCTDCVQNAGSQKLPAPGGSGSRELCGRTSLILRQLHLPRQLAVVRAGPLRRGVHASTSDLLLQAGMRILQRGGNAADAAVAVAAGLNMTEPCSTGPPLLPENLMFPGLLACSTDQDTPDC